MDELSITKIDTCMAWTFLVSFKEYKFPTLGADIDFVAFQIVSTVRWIVTPTFAYT